MVTCKFVPGKISAIWVQQQLFDVLEAGMTPGCFPPPQVILLTWEQHLTPVEVELVFPSTEDKDTYTVTCRTATNHLVRTLEQGILADILFFLFSLEQNLLNLSAGVCGAH